MTETDSSKKQAQREQQAQAAAERHGWPARQMTLVGVTGTCGKTSCTHFLADALGSLSVPCGIVGTLGSGRYGYLQSTGLTTPAAPELQGILADFVREGVKVTAMEVSSHGLVQARVHGIQFAAGLFTGLSRDHLDYHGSMEAYAAAKTRLFLQSDVAILNVSDAFGASLADTLPGKKITCGQDPQAMVQVQAIRPLAAGHVASIYTPWGKGEMRVPVPGLFNVENALLVLATLCGVLDIALDRALAVLGTLKPVPGRMQVLGGDPLPWVVVDYAHKPDALEKVLQNLRQQYAEGKLSCVFGCGGDRDRGKRLLMGEIAGRLADQVFVTDDNPRHESPAQIVTDILQGVSAPVSPEVIHDRGAAITAAIHAASVGDCILVAGKGAETAQQVGHLSLPFSDVDAVKAALLAHPIHSLHSFHAGLSGE